MAKNKKEYTDVEAMQIYLKLGHKYPSAKAKAKADKNFVKFADKFEDAINHTNADNKASVDHEKGTITLSLKQFYPDKGNPEYHNQNIKVINTLVMLEIGCMIDRITHGDNVTQEEIDSSMNYATTKLTDLHESIKYLSSDPAFKRTSTIFAEVAIYTFIEKLKERKL
jgi:hypothetical protein